MNHGRSSSSAHDNVRYESHDNSPDGILGHTENTRYPFVGRSISYYLIVC